MKEQEEGASSLGRIKKEEVLLEQGRVSTISESYTNEAIYETETESGT